MARGYVYQAEVWCEECGEKICEDLVKSGRAQGVIPWKELKGDTRNFGDVPMLSRAENGDSDALATLWDTFELIPGRSGAELDEGHYDSDDYPKSFSEQDTESDSVHHCAAGEECLNAIELPSGRKVGAILTDSLTEEGQKAFEQDAKSDTERSEVKVLWAEQVHGASWPKDLYPVHLCTSDDSPFDITVHVEGPYAHEWADHDQSIEGSSWECARDMPEFAYTSILWHPSLIEDLRAEGYDLDLSEFSEPENEDIQVATHMSQCAECQHHWDFSEGREHWQRTTIPAHPNPVGYWSYPLPVNTRELVCYRRELTESGGYYYRTC